MSESHISQKIAVARTFDRLVDLFNGLLRVGSGCAVAVLVLFLFDYQLHLPVIGRAFAWLVLLAVAGYLLYRFVIRPQVVRRTDDGIALRVESKYPSLRGRLIATVQLTRQMDTWYRRGVALIVETLRKQTEAVVRPLRFSVITPFKPLARSTGLLGGVALLCAVAITYQAEEFTAFAQRMAFLNVKYPSRTRILVVLPGDSENPCPVVRGSSIEISAKLGGLSIPKEAELEMTDKGTGRSTTIQMTERGNHRFEVVIAKVLDSFTYRIHAGDATADADPSGHPYTVAVRYRPIIAVNLDLSYPTYTRTANTRVEGGVARAIEGTRVSVTARCTNKDIGDIRLVYLTGPNARDESKRALAMKKSGRTATVEFPDPLQYEFQFTVWMKDTEGVENFSLADPGNADNPAPVYSLRVVPDQRPRVAVSEPNSEMCEVRDDSQLVVRAHAADDFGIVSVWLRWKLARADYAHQADKTEKWQDEPLYQVGAQAAPTALNDLTYTIAPRLKGAVAGDSIVFHVEARDHTAPVIKTTDEDSKSVPRGIGRSKEYTIMVIDEKRFKERLQQQMAAISEMLFGVKGRWEDKVYIPIRAPVEPEKK